MIVMIILSSGWAIRPHLILGISSLTDPSSLTLFGGQDTNMLEKSSSAAVLHW